MVWLFLIPLWKDACPRNRQTQYLKSHLPKQGDILFIMMVKVYGMMAGIVFALPHFFGKSPRRRFCPRGDMV